MASPQNPNLSSDHQPPELINTVALSPTAPLFFPNNPFPRFHHFFPPPVNYFISGETILLPPPPQPIFIPYPLWRMNPNPNNQFESMHALSPNPSQELTHSPPINRKRVFRRRRNTARRRGSPTTINHGGHITTVMLRNIPNKYTREMMIAFLDNHCEKANANEDDEEFFSAYDFFYLPMDFKTGMNLGYAFVNFTRTEAVWKFKVASHNQPWVHFHSRKILQIATARIQGKYELMKHFEEMAYPVEEYSAVCFRPPRSGPSDTVQTIMVGRGFQPRILV